METNNKEFLNLLKKFIKEKDKERQSIKRDYELANQDFYIASLLLNVLLKKDKLKNQSFSICSHSKCEDYICYEKHANNFINLFKNNECLKLEPIEDFHHQKDMIFLIDESNILIISFEKNWNLDEDAFNISAKVKPILSCKGNNYTKQKYNRDPLYCKTWYEPIEAFTFKDESNDSLTILYKSNNLTKNYQDKDIRTKLKVISIEEILERIMNKKELTETKTLILKK